MQFYAVEIARYVFAPSVRYVFDSTLTIRAETEMA